MADWKKEILHPLDVGMNKSVPPDALQGGASPNVLNMIFSGGRIETDYGISDKGGTVLGVPRLIHSFRRKNGVTEIILITTTRIYKWASGEWQYLRGPQATTVSGQHTATDTTIAVADDTGFSDGDPVGIIMDNGKQHRTTVNGAPAGNVITITDGVPAGRTFEDGAAFIETPVYTGQLNSPVTADTFPADDVLIFTNGRDNVQYYDGTSVQDVPNLVTAVGGSNCYADIVKVKDNKVILFNTNENGSNYPQRVRWCATGDYTDWTTANDAGYEDLYDTEDPVIAVARVGNDMAIYRDGSIYLMQYVGTTDLIYFFNRISDSEGAASAHSVIEHRRVNIVMGKQGFYVYSGGVEITEFGTELWEEIFGTSGLFSTDHANVVHGFYLEEGKEYLFIFPAYGNASPTMIARYSILDTAWSLRELGRATYHSGDAKTISGLVWLEATGNWEDTEWTSIDWDDITLQAGDSEILFAGVDGDGNGQVFDYNADNTDDDGVDISGEFRTREILQPEDYIRINRLVVKGKGSPTIEYSEDQGDSWSSFGSLSLGSSYSVDSVWKQLVTKNVMFRFTGTEFGLDRITIEWMPESRY